MDFVNKIVGDNKSKDEDKTSQDQGRQEGKLGGFMDKLNSVAGGGKESEKNEDALDKGVDWVQEHVLGQGDQSNESAAEQAKDEKISDFIREQYKKSTGTDFPVKDKDRF
ncbi:hypothetical protein O1611_g10115 [Lasiodiplodia mahajangana]|uniref:Uncharacterized protein n=1 Tax=Lasiodiplodia mahajangana TaxID=1108764 RepID=A0ACC2J2H4_9PEZI|nr:hypothetical protein O1611_g10115 [Lasiodiplodia mahajangana]